MNNGRPSPNVITFCQHHVIDLLILRQETTDQLAAVDVHVANSHLFPLQARASWRDLPEDDLTGRGRLWVKTKTWVIAERQRIDGAK